MLPKRTIWPAAEQADLVQIIDQRYLPHQLVMEDLRTYTDAARAIREMHVRGAPLIGATAAWGLYLACVARLSPAELAQAADTLRATRPTAVDLFYAIDHVLDKLASVTDAQERIAVARAAAMAYTDASAEQCAAIGKHGLPLIQDMYERTQAPVQILTHCNAGWLACIEHGTATAPIYRAHEAGIPVHVWVDETRPRLQGARLTAFELGQAGVPHTIITDNSGGHLMQHGKVDMVIVGSDRTTRTGDVANKIGTYLKALAAQDNGVPFYVALPESSIDWTLRDGVQEIKIEERQGQEVSHIYGVDVHGIRTEVLVAPVDSPTANHGFDVTPARLVTALITERGSCPATEAGLLQLYPERASIEVE